MKTYQDEITGENCVHPEAACPRCGEYNVDRLVWINDEYVKCLNCGTEYDPEDN